MLNDVDEKTRLGALHALEILNSGADPIMDQICALASDIFKVPAASVTLLDEKHQWLKARCGLDRESTPREQAFCNHTILENGVMVVPDARLDPRFAENPLVTGCHGIRFYAGAPLELEPGIRLGALCILDYRPRSFSARNQKRLLQLAMLVVGQIRLHAANLDLKQHARQIERRQSDLLWTATHDGLTRLPNRALFQDALETEIRALQAGGPGGGLLFIDLDEFKRINDTLGHDAGDALLVEVARRLSSIVKAPSLVARLGGDEFAILLAKTHDPARLIEMSADVVASLRRPIAHEGTSFGCTASIGQALFPDHAQTAREVLRSADLALYAAKDGGRNRAVMYHPALRDQFQARVMALDRARDALDRNAVLPYYQPKVSVGTGRVVGFEALLRWQDPILGLQTPATIWDAFSDPILSVELGSRMRDLVLADMAGWKKEGVPFGSIAINVSAAEFSGGDLATTILEKLEALELPASTLELEVTETVFLGDEAGEIGRSLTILNDAGISIALDDFGTGYASLTHLRQFPIQWLKIDRSFVADMHVNRESAAIVNTIIELAQSLRIGVVAEGIETTAQLDMLKNWNCDVGQGFFYGRPIEAALLSELLRSWSSTDALAQLRLVG